MSIDDRQDTRPNSMRRLALTAVVVVAIAGAGGAAIYAATDQPERGRHQPWHAPSTMSDTGRHADSAAPPTDSLHGEFVTAAPGGGYRTVVTQTGVITALSPGSITARSADGFTQTYVIPPTAAQGPAHFATGQVVTVRATRDGDVATVTTIGFAAPAAG